MRETKFRVWYEHEGYMFAARAVDFESREVRIDGFDWSEKRQKELPWITILKLDDVTLMQFTGLKDKNGVEAYEDDVISDGADWYVIKYDLRGTRYMKFWHGHDNDNTSSGLFNMASYEVIGNIHDKLHETLPTDPGQELATSPDVQDVKPDSKEQ